MTTPLSSPVLPETDIRRVAILFSGGPAPAANAVIASAATCFSCAGIEVMGIRNGYSHLMDYKPGQELQEGTAYMLLDHKKLEGRRTSQGVIIGTARANPGSQLQSPRDFKDPNRTAKLKRVYDALCSLEVDGLVSIGGDDTLTTANKFRRFQDELQSQGKLRRRIRAIHVPKTIDNDYHGIDFTFGYFTAVDMLATQIHNLLADSMATGTYFLAQLMGRQAGWLAYGAAIAGEASLVIGLEDIPSHWRAEEAIIDPATGEQVLDKKTGKPQLREIVNLGAIVRRIVETMVARDEAGKPYGVVVMAEGLAEYLPLAEIHQCLSEDEYKRLKPDEFGHFPVSQLKFSSRMGLLIAKEYEKRTGKKKRVNGVQFGYEVRCNAPTAFDIILASQLGVGAYRGLVENGLDGVMVSFEGQLKLIFVPFEDSHNPQESLIDPETLKARVRLVQPGEDFHQLARYLEGRVAE